MMMSSLCNHKKCTSPSKHCLCQISFQFTSILLCAPPPPKKPNLGRIKYKQIHSVKTNRMKNCLTVNVLARSFLSFLHSVFTFVIRLHFALAARTFGPLYVILGNEPTLQTNKLYRRSKMAPEMEANSRVLALLPLQQK